MVALASTSERGASGAYVHTSDLQRLAGLSIPVISTRLPARRSGWNITASPYSPALLAHRRSIRKRPSIAPLSEAVRRVCS
jgi:hypothetical protein